MQEYSLLLVEDDEELAELIQDYLQTMEFKVDIENDGAKAMTRIINEQPDIVLQPVSQFNRDVNRLQ